MLSLSPVSATPVSSLAGTIVVVPVGVFSVEFGVLSPSIVFAVRSPDIEMALASPRVSLKLSDNHE